jgi:hypothetical protein
MQALAGEILAAAVLQRVLLQALMQALLTAACLTVVAGVAEMLVVAPAVTAEEAVLRAVVLPLAQVRGVVAASVEPEVALVVMGVAVMGVAATALVVGAVAMVQEAV